MSQQWQRRSSALRRGGRPSQDAIGGPASRYVERNSRIPLPRSSSQTAVPHKPDPHSGFKRSKSTLGAPFTPQEKMGGSVKITPQAVSFTPKLYGSYSSKKKGHPKDLRNLQDKEFQKEAAYTVLNYFQSFTTIKITEIRPMTIKTFIEMVNHCFNELGIYNKDELVQFTTANYVKELPHWMGTLEYPGSINKGWLQTVNVPQCWPQVIGLLSWLVSLVQLTTLFNFEGQLNHDTDRDQDKLFQVTCLNACLAVHNRIRIDGEEESVYTDMCEEVIKISEQIHGVTEDAFTQLINEKEKLLQKTEDPELKKEQTHLEELEKQLNAAQAQSMDILDELEKLAESIEQIKINEERKERNIEELRNTTELMQKEVEDLKRRVDTQFMSITEFAGIKKKCDNLLQEISYQEKECEDSEKIVSEYEQNIAGKRDKILENASMFNRQVIQLEQQIPGLQGFRVRTNPESTDAVEDATKLVRALRDFKSRLTAEWEELEVLRLEKKQRVDKLKQRLSNAASSEVTVRERVLTKKTEIEQLRAEVAEEEKKLKFEINDLEKRQMVFQQKQQEYDHQIQQIQQMEKKSELYERCREKMIELEAIQWEKIEAKAEKIKSELRSLENKLKDNETEIEGLIDQLMSELHKD